MEFTLIERNLVLVGHILGAILFIGPTTAAASIFPRLALAGDTPGCEQTHRISRVYGTMTGLVPAFGLYLGFRMGYLDRLWLQLSLGIFLVSFALLMMGIVPLQRDVLESGLASLARESVQRLRVLTGIYAMSWVVTLYLMVAKPG